MVLGLVFLLGGCSQVPKPASYRMTFQKKMQAAKHWDFLAEDVADQVSICCSARQGCDLGQGQGLFVEPKLGVFGRAFTNMLISHLVQPKGKRAIEKGGCLVLQSREEGCLVLQFETQVIKHRTNRFNRPLPGTITVLAGGLSVVRDISSDTLKAWGIGSAVLADIFLGSTVTLPHHEVLITTSLIKDNQYLFSKTDLYYINDPDSWHYPTEEMPAVRFGVKGDECEVAERGPGADSDGDGVPDSIDQCPGTPRGVKVDSRGCPFDSDGDGVFDYLDRCPQTPGGVKVDSRGCPFDSDGDGVPDSIDQCPGTPRGVRVDIRGCPFDSDGDGVSDSIDKCPGTPQGATVDARGCWFIQNALFDFDKYDIKRQYYPVIDNVVDILRKNPSLKISIHGYTDYKGSDAYNQILSKNRAKSVKYYLMKKGIEERRLFAAGYGKGTPKASTAVGRALNRRIEFILVH